MPSEGQKGQIRVDSDNFYMTRAHREFVQNSALPALPALTGVRSCHE